MATGGAGTALHSGKIISSEDENKYNAEEQYDSDWEKEALAGTSSRTQPMEVMMGAVSVMLMGASSLILVRPKRRA